MYDLEKDNDYIVSKIPELLINHEGEFVVVHDCSMQGFFKDRSSALEWTRGRVNVGEFIIKEITKDYLSPKFISFRVAFNE